MIKKPVRAVDNKPVVGTIEDADGIFIIGIAGHLIRPAKETKAIRDEVIQALNGYGDAVKAVKLILNTCSTCSAFHREKAYELLNDLGELHD